MKKKAQKITDKPFIAREYAHAMGNSMGNMKEYMDVIYGDSSIAGAAIWDWVDQGLAKPKDGSKMRLSSSLQLHDDEFWAYGGDFGDVPNLKAFCVKGIVSSDRKLTPKYNEVKQVYAPMDVQLTGNRLHVVMLDNMVEMDNYRIAFNITENGKVIKKGEIKDLTVPSVKFDPAADVRLNVSIQLKSDTKWAKAGFEVKHEQFAINDRLATAFSPMSLKTGREADMKEAMEWFDIVKPHFFRAPLDNDKGFGNWIAKDWKNSGLDSATVETVQPLTTQRNDDGTVTATMTVVNRYAKGEMATAYSCTMDSQGNVDFQATYTPSGELPPLPCMGNTFTLPKQFTRVEWYGMGPYDTYPDRLEAAHIGLWSSSVDQQYVHYPRPQDSGNHQQTVMVKLTDNKGKGWMITAEDGQHFSFSALPYSIAQLSTTAHDCDLVAEDNVYLNIDAAVMGIGNSSCGPGVLSQYAIAQKPHTLHLRFTKLK